MEICSLQAHITLKTEAALLDQMFEAGNKPLEKFYSEVKNKIDFLE